MKLAVVANFLLDQSATDTTFVSYIRLWCHCRLPVHSQDHVIPNKISEPNILSGIYPWLGSDQGGDNHDHIRVTNIGMAWGNHCHPARYMGQPGIWYGQGRIEPPPAGLYGRPALNARART